MSHGSVSVPRSATTTGYIRGMSYFFQELNQLIHERVHPSGQALFLHERMQITCLLLTVYQGILGFLEGPKPFP